jgi:hypothetical protein
MRLDRAAGAERVLADPAASINDKVRDGAAHRARLAMAATLHAAKRVLNGPTLAEYIASKAKTAGAPR